PDEVQHRDHVAYGEHGSAGGGKDMQHLKLFRVRVVAARHPKIPQYELREKSQVEPEEDDQGGKLRPSLGIHAARHLRPPVMQSTQIAHDGAAHHDVVKVRDHEVRVGDVNVDSKCRHEQAR